MERGGGFVGIGVVYADVEGLVGYLPEDCACCLWWLLNGGDEV